MEICTMSPPAPATPSCIIISGGSSSFSSSITIKSLDQVSPCKTTVSTPCSTATGSLTTADDWYALGERLWYDPVEKKIAEPQRKHQEDEEAEPQPEDVDSEEPPALELFQVFQRVVLPTTNRSETCTTTCCDSGSQRWMTFLPSNPEGSYGFHLVEDALSFGIQKRSKSRCDTDSTEMSTAPAAETHKEGLLSDDAPPGCCPPNPLVRLYLDYQGQGDSDTPLLTPGSSITKQRADLVEALWALHGIKRTVVVSAGDSSLVVMELLQRQRQRLASGSPFPKILHVLSLNGRYVAKTRHSAQLATVTQLLRSDRVGPSLAAKAQRSEFTLSQCLAPYLKGSSRFTRKQVAQVVRRHEGCSSLVEMARTVDDHLDEKHRYRWHLPHLFKVFTLDQGITFHLVTNTRSGQRQVQLVHQQLQDYELDGCPGVRYSDYGGRACSTSTFLLDSPSNELAPFIFDIHRLVNEQIPLSDNSLSLNRLDSGALSSFHFHGEEEGEDDDSWHPNEVEEDPSTLDVGEEQNNEEPSLDTRLHREIVFDAREMDEEDWELF